MYKHLKKWTRPDHYVGRDWPDYYVFLGQNRDSDTLTRSNFVVGLRNLGGESDTVRVVRERHWACGWIEFIAIHESDTKALQAAESMLQSIEDYPALCDDHWSELEHNEIGDWYESLSVRERADYCRRAGVSIFAARRSWPEGQLYDYLRDTWH